MIERSLMSGEGGMDQGGFDSHGEDTSPEAFEIKEGLLESLEDIFLKEMKLEDIENQLSTQRRYFEEHAVEFFTSLISITKRYRESKSDRLEVFLQATHTALFSYSPSVSNFVPLLERIGLAAEISRLEELRGYAGQNINGELVYDLAFSRYTAENIIEYLTKEGGKKTEDIIHQLETIYADALANGEWAEPAAEKISKVIHFFLTDSRPLVRMVAEVAEDHIEKEKKDPTMGVLTFVGNSHKGRMDSSASVDVSLTDKCKHNLPVGYKAIGISADVIIGQDTAGMPRYAGYADVEQVSQTEDIGFRIIQQLEQLEGLSFFRVRLRQFINILAKAKTYYAPDKTVSEFYAEILDLPMPYVESIIDSGADIGPFF